MFLVPFVQCCRHCSVKGSPAFSKELKFEKQSLYSCNSQHCRCNSQHCSLMWHYVLCNSPFHQSLINGTQGRLVSLFILKNSQQCKQSTLVTDYDIKESIINGQALHGFLCCREKRPITLILLLLATTTFKNMWNLGCADMNTSIWYNIYTRLCKIIKIMDADSLQIHQLLRPWLINLLFYSFYAYHTSKRVLACKYTLF